MKKLAVILSALVLILALTGCDSRDYKKAAALYEEGKYQEAEKIFLTLGDYENSQEMVLACKYSQASDLYTGKDYEGALAIFETITSYQNVKDMIPACKYGMANDLYNEGDREGAITLLESISDFPGAEELRKKAAQELMYEAYGDVIQALDGNFWYFNGGSNTLLNRIQFADTEAVIDQVTFDGNGHHSSGSNAYPYTIQADAIAITMAGGVELEIPYTFDGSAVSLGGGEYLTEAEVEEDLQGFWKLNKKSVVLGMSTHNQTYFHINNGKLTYERAASAYGKPKGEYYYYGPYEGAYTLTFGGFNCDVNNSFSLGFNVIGGKAVMMYYGDVCEPADKLPGQYGYSF